MQNQRIAGTALVEARREDHAVNRILQHMQDCMATMQIQIYKNLDEIDNRDVSAECKEQLKATIKEQTAAKVKLEASIDKLIVKKNAIFCEIEKLSALPLDHVLP